MSRLSIITAPDPILRKKSAPLETIDDALRALMDDMLEAMVAGDGIGLAAIQVGVAKRLIVTKVAEGDEPPVALRLVNPEILWRADEPSVYEEGCLSLPDQLAEVERPERVRVAYLDETGERRELEAGGLLATCLQHEIDHLDGVLFVDHLSLVKRSMIIRKLKKAQRQKTAAPV
jgi:peptide deformylase